VTDEAEGVDDAGDLDDHDDGPLAELADRDRRAAPDEANEPAPRRAPRRFTVSGGAVTIAENPLESSVEATLDVASVNSGEAGRDEHLLSADFFDVENYPTITFRSTKVTAAGDGEYKLTGELTIKDVTRPVTLDLEYLGTIDSPFGDTRAGFSASTEISRKDWGLGWNVALEAGGVVVSDKVKINIDAETILQK